MKLPLSGYVLGSTTDTLIRALTRILPQFASQINAASEGRIAGAYNALEQPPTQGLYAQGDYIRNLTPAVQGGVVTRGWICVAGGEPGTWVADRVAVTNTIQNPELLGSSTDLDDVVAPGFYAQAANVNATPALHYPVQRAGVLVVLKAGELGPSAAGVIQVYLEYRSSNRFQRGSSDGITWTAWG